MHHPNHAKYHHYSPLVKAIDAKIAERGKRPLSTTMRKVRAHPKVRGNTLTNVAAKLAEPSFPMLSAHQAHTIIIGQAALRPDYWVMPPLPIFPSHFPFLCIGCKHKRVNKLSHCGRCVLPYAGSPSIGIKRSRSMCCTTVRRFAFHMHEKKP